MARGKVCQASTRITAHMEVLASISQGTAGMFPGSQASIWLMMPES